MKTAKRVLAILMAMLMAVSAFAVAASAAVSLQTLIDNNDGTEPVRMPTNTKESVTITKDVTIDLGGRILKSANGSPAITVKNGATVTIQNGYVESFYTAYSGATQKTLEILGEITTKAPAGIMASGTGTKVILNDVRVLGGLVRIPKTSEWYVPAGSAVKIYGGAQVELNNAVLVGSYAVSNDPANTGRADGKVIVNDAVLFGYVDYIKRVYNGLVYDEATVEKVNAADRIAGALQDNITLTDAELSMLKKIMDDRVYIFTTKPTDDEAVVTIDKTVDPAVATITAEQVKDLKNTDCSYKYVPENAYDAATGDTFPLDTVIPASEVIGKEIRINYRLDFQLKGDFKKLAENFDHYYRTYYAKAVQKADAALTQALNAYENKIKDFVEIFNDVDKAGAESVTVNGQTYNAANALGDDYWAIQRGILSLGGVKLYNQTKAGQREIFTTIKFSKDNPMYKFGEKVPAGYVAEDTYDAELDMPYTTHLTDESEFVVKKVTQLGVLDKVEALKNEFLAIKGDASLGDQSKWNAYAHFVLDNYQKVLDLVEETKTAVDTLYTTFTTGSIGDLVTSMGMQKELNMLKGIKDALRDVQAGIDTALSNEIVDSVKAKIDEHANDGTVEAYMRKVKTLVNNYETYVDLDKLVEKNDADGTLLKTYRVNGPTRVETIEKGKLNIRVSGSGSVAYASDIASVNGTWDRPAFDGLAYDKAITLTATAGEGMEFMYYVIVDTQRIYSTNPVCVVDTQAETYLEAVFEDAGAGKVVFTNNSGVIAAVKDYNGSVSTSDVVEPGTAGFQMVGWGPNGNKTSLSNADFTSAYKSGSSAFENGAVYTITGFGFKLRSTTENKYLVTPKLESKQLLSVYFTDDANAEGEYGSDEVPFGHVITYTAQGDNFAYWIDDDENIVSVYATYAVEALKDVHLTAVYNRTAPEAVITIPHFVYESNRVLVYSERSVGASRNMISTGFVVSFVDAVSTEEQLNVNAVDRVNVFRTQSTMKTKQGVSSVGLTYATMNNSGHDGVAYVRAYVELETATGSEFIYSPIEIYEAP